MKRNGFDERRDQQIAAEYHAGHMACSFCGAMTSKDDLSTFGARCRACYDAYCTGGRYFAPLTPQQRRNMGAAVRAALGGQLRLQGREHIAQLQRRADAGESLSPGQRGFLQAVRRASGIVDDPAPRAQPQQQEEPLQVLAAPLAVEQADQPEDLPPWVLDDVPLADAAQFPDPNHVSAEAA